MQTYLIQTKTQADDGIGGKIERWDDFKTVRGYLDLQSGTDARGADNAITEKSTHLLIIPNYTEGITDDMRVLDPRTGRTYAITYPDDPVGVGHHNELYLTYTGKDGIAHG